MFVAQENNTLISEAIETGVSIYVADGLSPKMLKSILQIAIVQFTKFRKLQEELDKSKVALADRKVVERAKGPLMAHKGLTEEEAYRFLRRLAMDQNKRLAEIAENILSLAQASSKADATICTSLWKNLNFQNPNCLKKHHFSITSPNACFLSHND